MYTTGERARQLENGAAARALLFIDAVFARADEDEREEQDARFQGM
jgi:hypothetical protein